MDPPHMAKFMSRRAEMANDVGKKKNHEGHFSNRTSHTYF